MAKSTDVKSTPKSAAAKEKKPAEVKPAKASKSTPATSSKIPATTKASKVAGHWMPRDSLSKSHSKPHVT